MGHKPQRLVRGTGSISVISRGLVMHTTSTNNMAAAILNRTPGWMLRGSLVMQYSCSVLMHTWCETGQGSMLNSI